MLWIAIVAAKNVVCNKSKSKNKSRMGDWNRAKLTLINLKEIGKIQIGTR